MKIGYSLTAAGELVIARDNTLNDLIDHLFERRISDIFTDVIVEEDICTAAAIDHHFILRIPGHVQQALLMLQTMNATARTAMLDYLVSQHLEKIKLIVEREGLKRELDHVTEEGYRDKLTQIFNRKAYHAIGERIARYHLENLRPLSLLFMDIDNFKQYNEAPLNHDYGDAVLKELSNILSGISTATELSAQRIIRETDALFRVAGKYEQEGIATRVMGDEFAVLLPSTSGKSATIVAQRILDTLKQHIISYRGHELRVSVSVGIATLGEECYTFEDLHTTADQKLMQGKKIGKGNYYSRHHPDPIYRL